MIIFLQLANYFTYIKFLYLDTIGCDISCAVCLANSYFICAKCKAGYFDSG